MHANHTDNLWSSSQPASFVKWSPGPYYSLLVTLGLVNSSFNKQIHLGPKRLKGLPGKEKNVPTYHPLYVNLEILKEKILIINPGDKNEFM